MSTKADDPAAVERTAPAPTGADERLAVASTAWSLGQPAPSDPGGEAALVADGQRYVPLGLLGEGGMGRVEHVWDSDLMRHLAVKRLRPDLTPDPVLVQQFLWEARVTAYLDHPNIAPVHDLGLSGGKLYFTMPRVGGRSLDAVIARLHDGDRAMLARFPLPRRIRIFVQIAQAVAFAHARGVLHRDLKPGNVMLGEHGEIRVMDWGLAAPLPGPAGEPLRAMLPRALERVPSAGTPQYMSPEQARGEPLDERSDIYALGAILYELVALAPSVQGTSVTEVLGKLGRGETIPLDRGPASLRAIVARAMSFGADGRYATASALAADLETFLDGRTPEAERVSPLRRAARWYVARDPAITGLRVWELDMVAASTCFFGVAVGMLAARGWGAWWPAALGLSVAAGVPPAWRWWTLWRASRGGVADDLDGHAPR